MPALGWLMDPHAAAVADAGDDELFDVAEFLELCCTLTRTYRSIIASQTRSYGRRSVGGPAGFRSLRSLSAFSVHQRFRQLTGDAERGRCMSSHLPISGPSWHWLLP